ncbi:MAG: dihydroorotase [Planctomycetes bacterium]|nr:dihydroorotase [Planctomycetota bacterium]
MNVLRIANGRIIDPSQDIDRVAELWVQGERILGIGPQSLAATQTLDATGMIVAPGLIDMHVQLCEPGREEDETIASGTAAALAGGITSLACMPNTEPAIDNQAAAEFVYLQAERAGSANVFPVGAVTKGRRGAELAEIGGLIEGGAVAFTDADAPVVSAEIMRRALEYCRMFDKPVLTHPEDPELTRGGVMHEGFESMRLGLRGMPPEAEEVMIHRDIELARLTGGRLHILNVSTGGGVELIRRAKERGLRVTAEVSPHHLCLTDQALQGFDSNFKVNPPLRTKVEINALIEGLKDGILDVIASGHAPLASEKKTRELDLAPFGIVGLETLLPICVVTLIEPGHLTWPQLLQKLTVNPARILGIDRGTLRPGADADITIIDPKTEWTIDPKRFHSKSRNSPFAGMKVRGRAQTVIVGGVVRD